MHYALLNMSQACVYSKRAIYKRDFLKLNKQSPKKNLNVSAWGQRSASFWNRAALQFHVCGKRVCGTQEAGQQAFMVSQFLGETPPCK